MASDSVNKSLGQELLAAALELSYTTRSIAVLGQVLGADKPRRWGADRRPGLLRTVDAISAHLFRLSREESEHVLSTFETLARREVKARGEYRTARLALQAYDDLAPVASASQTRACARKGEC